ncbi:MAG TPA: hypothetical protein PLM48_09705 [Clostridia bacterium]|nr:hypothetical protein [Clostridia bacterium]
MNESEIRDFIDQNRDSSERELIRKLEGMTREQLATGELTDGKMDEIYELIGPMLTPKQAKRMKEIADKLRNIQAETRTRR